MYPKSIKINGRDVLLWYDLGMLNYTKMDRSFSIFQDNRTGINPVPYIKDYYILDYTTACHDPEDEFLGYKYTYEEVSAAAEDLNHGAGDGTHFFLLPTQMLDRSLSEGLIDYFQNMNYILDYGEFRHPEYEIMLRKGTKQPVMRSYDKYTQFSSDNTIKVITTSNVFTKILSKINNDAIVKNEQEILTKAYLQDITNADQAEEKVPLNNQDESTVNNPKEDKESQDVSLTIPLAESASDESKVVIPDQKGITKISEKSIELLLKEKKEAEFFNTTILPTIRLLSCTKGRDYKKIMDNMILQTNIFMNEFNLTNDDTIENNNDVSSSKQTNNDSKKNKSPKK
jgi:hypothetical protein